MRCENDQLYYGIALNVAKASSCNRLNVGALLLENESRKVISVGHNGNIYGDSMRCDPSKVGSCGCDHAETVAIDRYMDTNINQATLYVTHSPCLTCAKMIVKCGFITSVLFGEAYRIPDGIILLRESKIKVGMVYL